MKILNPWWRWFSFPLNPHDLIYIYWENPCVWFQTGVLQSRQNCFPISRFLNRINGKRRATVLTLQCVFCRTWVLYVGQQFDVAWDYTLLLLRTHTHTHKHTHTHTHKHTHMYVDIQIQDFAQKGLIAKFWKFRRPWGLHLKGRGSTGLQNVIASFKKRLQKSKFLGPMAPEAPQILLWTPMHNKRRNLGILLCCNKFCSVTRKNIPWPAMWHQRLTTGKASSLI